MIVSLLGTLTVGNNEPTGRRPKALEEAKNLRRDSVAGSTRSTQGGCKGSTLDKCAVLAGRREERAALDFFP